MSQVGGRRLSALAWRPDNEASALEEVLKGHLEGRVRAVLEEAGAGAAEEVGRLRVLLLELNELSGVDEEFEEWVRKLEGLSEGVDPEWRAEAEAVLEERERLQAAAQAHLEARVLENPTSSAAELLSRFMAEGEQLEADREAFEREFSVEQEREECRGDVAWRVRLL